RQWTRLGLFLCEHVSLHLLVDLIPKSLMYSRFLDRDMVMRYRGGGGEHKSTRQATQCVFDDRDELDYLSCSTVRGPSGGSGEGENDGDDSSSELEFPHSSDGE